MIKLNRYFKINALVITLCFNVIYTQEPLEELPLKETELVKIEELPANDTEKVKKEVIVIKEDDKLDEETDFIIEWRGNDPKPLRIETPKLVATIPFDDKRAKAMKAISITMIILGYTGAAGGVPFFITAFAIDEDLALGLIPMWSTASIFIPTGHKIYAKAKRRATGNFGSKDYKMEMGLSFDL